MVAAYSGQVGAMSLLMNAGADVNARKGSRFLGHGETALMWAAAEGHKEAVIALLEHGADVNVRSYCGTALGYALGRGHKGVEAILRLRGARAKDVRESCRGTLGYRQDVGK